MQFFFVPDFRHRFRFFGNEPVHEIQVEFSRWKKVWKTAKEKLMLLPVRTLRQEQAFESILGIQDPALKIYYPEDLGPKRVKKKFYFYLQRQKTKHIILLAAEALLLPISGLMALLPGPNVFFGFLALIMYTHWQALKGIKRLGDKKIDPIPSALLQEWSNAVKDKDESRYGQILSRISEKYGLSNLRKILYK